EREQRRGEQTAGPERPGGRAVSPVWSRDDRQAAERNQSGAQHHRSVQVRPDGQERQDEQNPPRGSAAVGAEEPERGGEERIREALGAQLPGPRREKDTGEPDPENGRRRSSSSSCGGHCDREGTGQEQD